MYMSYVMSYVMSLCLIPCLMSFCLLSSQNTDPGLMLTPVQDNLNAADLKVLSLNDHFSNKAPSLCTFLLILLFL